MEINDILKIFGLETYKELFIDLYNVTVKLANLDEEKRNILDVSGGEDTIWDRLSDVLSYENEAKEIEEIVGQTYTEVVEFFKEARICLLMCEAYLESHPLAFMIDVQVVNAINLFMNLGASGSLMIK